MIFVTVGTTKFPFNRLLKVVDEAVLKLRLKEELIAQIGASNYQFKHPKTRVFKEVPFNKMISYLKKARVIVTHGGPVTIFLALKYGKYKLLVVPRFQKLGEHTDDHQLFFTQFLKKKKLIEVVLPNENLTARIGDYLEFPEKLPSKKRAPDLERLVEKLIEYTESLR